MEWKVLRQENVDYVVAPYEADAQMTFLAITNQVDAIITEDSDLIPFGCPRVSFLFTNIRQNHLHFLSRYCQLLIHCCFFFDVPDHL